MQEEKKQLKRRRLNGIVVSDKMEKTIVVRVDRASIHPKYQKRYTLSSKYKAHDPKNTFKTGDAVTIEEARPMSKSKRWRVVEEAAK
ncbi:MAG: 30S ribosomal protein S17 [Patescibacteria group bacterium]